ncbi:MAG TPA: NAD-dependent epimerase/dehydratase family protein [Solirubrobacteraceae bacterium]|nr:NAD-dependent epimerase/dehydratase family protein [Solirubrobacteraceae bacterium]
MPHSAHRVSRTLVTGCAGFIGSHLTESLLTDGVDVIGVDCFNDNYARPAKLRNLERAREWDAFDFVPIDLARGELADLVAEVDTVFHLAAEPGVRRSWGTRFETYLRNNLLATQHLLEACKDLPSTRFVYASSSSLYGQAEAFPTYETAVPRPLSPYGVTKLAAEQLCFSFHHNFGLDAVSLRYFSVFGPRQRPDMMFNRLCEAALAGSTVTVFGDGQQTRDFTYVADIVAATRTAATAPAVVGGAYNIGGGSRVSLMSVIDLLGGLAQRPISIVHAPTQHGDVRDTAAAIELAQRDLAYEPAVTVQDGLARQLEWAIAERRRDAAVAR